MTGYIRWSTGTNVNISKPEKRSIRTEGKGVYDLRTETLFNRGI